MWSRYHLGRAGPTVKPFGPAPTYPWPKLGALLVTAAGTTTISNRPISIASPMPTGCHVYCRPQATYVQPSAAGAPPDNTTADAAVPAGYTEVTFTAMV